MGKKIDLPLCKCGCEREIIIKYHHKYYGTPKFIKGHNAKGKNHPLYDKKHSKDTIIKMSLIKKGKIFTEIHKKRISNGNKGKERTEEMKGKYRKSKIGKINPMYKKTHSIEARTKISVASKEHWKNLEYRGNMSEKMKGENNPCWKGGITNESHKRLMDNEWRKISRRIRERDSCTCQLCGKHKLELKNTLDVHHIIPYIISKNNDDTNLITLCRGCHTTYEHKIKQLGYLHLQKLIINKNKIKQKIILDFREKT